MTLRSRSTTLKIKAGRMVLRCLVHVQLNTAQLQFCAVNRQTCQAHYIAIAVVTSTLAVAAFGGIICLFVRSRLQKRSGDAFVPLV